MAVVLHKLKEANHGDRHDGRECVAEVGELPDECPVLIGQVPLELLDFVVDASGRRLIGNPDHGGEQMFDLF